MRCFLLASGMAVACGHGPTQDQHARVHLQFRSTCLQPPRCVILAYAAAWAGALFIPSPRNSQDRDLPQFKGGRSPATPCTCTNGNGNGKDGCDQGLRAGAVSSRSVRSQWMPSTLNTQSAPPPTGRTKLSVVEPRLLHRLQQMCNQRRGAVFARTFQRAVSAGGKNRVPHSLLQLDAQLREVCHEPDSVNQFHSSKGGMDAKHWRDRRR